MPSQSMRDLPDGYEPMIRRARMAVYAAEITSKHERRLVARMEAEGWLKPEVGAWSGERLYRATEKAVARV